MRRALQSVAILSLMAIAQPVLSAATTQTSKTRKKVAKRRSSRAKPRSRIASRTKTAPRSKSVVAAVPAPVRVSSAVTVQRVLNRTGGHTAIENEAALVPFFDQLYRSRTESKPVHILQFGDSHTASDDWANAMRVALQSRFGDGGPGFTDPGHPYRGYRNFRVLSGNSAGWVTQGTVKDPGDGREGLGGVSLSTSRAGESVWMQSEGDQVELYYLQQPAGSRLDFLMDGNVESTITTGGELAPAYFSYAPAPGRHTFEVRTVSNDPVRLFGWVVQNQSGVTYETLGINGAQADVVDTWDENVFEPQVSRRDPALIVFAYGTNEALSPRFTPDGYRAAFSEALARLRRASPTASILVVGPPDCWLKRRGRFTAFPHIDEVIKIQREVATEQRCAFWDWRQRMGGEGSKRRWVAAGLAQLDYVHFTGAGYQLVGNTLCADLMDLYNMFVSVRNQTIRTGADNDGSPEDHGRAQSGHQK